MATKRNSYKQLERLLSATLIFNAVLFVIYLFCAGFDVTWLKVILTLLIIFISVMCLYILYVSRELTKPRSLWMTVASVSLVLCLLVSLLLGFPGPA